MILLKVAHDKIDAYASALTAYWFFIWRKIYAPADLLCKYFNLAGAPKRTVGYLRCRTIPHCQMLDLGSPRPDEAILSTWQELRSANRSYGTVRLAKWKSWYKSRFRFFQNRMVNPCRKFFEPGFPHNFAKNDRQELKMGCTDASRRQLQSVLKIGV